MSTSILTPVQSFSLSYSLVKSLDDWNSKSTSQIVVPIAARGMGFVLTPFTSALDGVAHFSLCLVTATTGLVVSPYNFVVKRINADYAAPDDLGLISSLIHLVKTIESLFFIIVLPLVSLASLAYATSTAELSLTGERPQAQDTSSNAPSHLLTQSEAPTAPQLETITTEQIEEEDKFLKRPQESDDPAIEMLFEKIQKIEEEDSKKAPPTSDEINTKLSDLQIRLSPFKKEQQQTKRQLNLLIQSQPLTLKPPPVALKGKHLIFLDSIKDNPVRLSQVYTVINEFLQTIEESENEIPMSDLSTLTEEAPQLVTTPLKGNSKSFTPVEMKKITEFYRLLVAKLLELRKKNPNRAESNKSVTQHLHVIELSKAEKEQNELEERRVTLKKELLFTFPDSSHKTTFAKWKMELEKHPLSEFSHRPTDKMTKTTPDFFFTHYSEVQAWCNKDPLLTDKTMLERHLKIVTVLNAWSRQTLEDPKDVELPVINPPTIGAKRDELLKQLTFTFPPNTPKNLIKWNSVFQGKMLDTISGNKKDSTTLITIDKLIENHTAVTDWCKKDKTLSDKGMLARQQAIAAILKEWSTSQ